jgi:hypothetical protein
MKSPKFTAPDKRGEVLADFEAAEMGRSTHSYLRVARRSKDALLVRRPFNWDQW